MPLGKLSPIGTIEDREEGKASTSATFLTRRRLSHRTALRYLLSSGGGCSALGGDCEPVEVVNVACVNVEAPLTLCSRPRRERALRIRYGQSAARICLCRPERGTVRTQRPGNPRRTRSRSLPASIPIARRTCRGHRRRSCTRPEGAARRTGSERSFVDRGHRERSVWALRRCFSLAN